MRRNPKARSRFRRIVTPISLLAFLAVLPGAPIAASAATITGVVTDGTTQKPAQGDAVVLIALQQRMQEIARTKTDAQGRFLIESPDPGMHLVRVDHQGAAYFQPAPPNTPNVNVEVYDVSSSVAGVSTEANVMQLETDGQGLHVTQSFFVKNASNPPRTQFSNRSYEFYLPPNAQIEGSAAMGPGGMPVQSSPMPLGDKNHYAFLFPLRPGETHFQVSYRLPYSGSLALALPMASATANFAVMLPKSMSFVSADKAAFQSLNETPNAQTFLARNVAASQPVAFTVSGSGQMPRDTQTTEGESNTNQGSASTDTRPGGGLGIPIDTPDPLHKYKGWILGALGIALAIAAGFLLRKPGDAGSPAAVPVTAPVQPAAPNSGNSLLAALKEELFAIETDRLQGKLSESDYGNLKSALELVLRRALSRS